jgi:hypothetical protein
VYKAVLVKKRVFSDVKIKTNFDETNNSYCKVTVKFLNETKDLQKYIIAHLWTFSKKLQELSYSVIANHVGQNMFVCSSVEQL